RRDRDFASRHQRRIGTYRTVRGVAHRGGAHAPILDSTCLRFPHRIAEPFLAGKTTEKRSPSALMKFLLWWSEWLRTTRSALSRESADGGRATPTWGGAPVS